MSTWLIARQCRTAHHDAFHRRQRFSRGRLSNLLGQDLIKKRKRLYLEARIAQRHLLVKQIHERELDFKITTKVPKWMS